MRSIWRTLDRSTRAGIAAVLAAVTMIGISYGATAIGYGFPLWLPVALGVVVLAGGAEFLFLGILAAGGNPFAAVAAGLIVNARHLPYGLSLPAVTGSGPRRLLGTHVMNDESVAVALAQPDLARKRAAYWCCGIGVMVAWPLGATLGAILGSVIPDIDAFGLDAVFPAVLIALVVPALRERDTRGPVALGVAIALVGAPFLPVGLPVLCALAGLLVAARWPSSATRQNPREPSSRPESAAAQPSAPETPADSDAPAHRDPPLDPETPAGLDAAGLARTAPLGYADSRCGDHGAARCRASS
ncbi:AzlC family ABC transporter permease [Nocardia bovistercoris]|uniref:AzlC family ABC transporter permease n=1 Tax=Nocardia bovistercoris TaxID=2785916 RepID=A0A931I9X8_9NOCA|nr:AzlC family ABC transporter permease [Nocardia bovistercoris]